MEPKEKAGLRKYWNSPGNKPEHTIASFSARARVLKVSPRQGVHQDSSRKLARGGSTHSMQSMPLWFWDFRLVLIRQRELESDKNFYCLVFLRIGILPVDLTASPRHPTTWDMIILQQIKHSSGSGQTQGAQQRKLRRRVEIPSFISTSSKETNPGIKMKEVGALAPDLGASKSEDSSNFYVPHLYPDSQGQFSQPLSHLWCEFLPLQEHLQFFHSLLNVVTGPTNAGGWTEPSVGGNR